MKLQKIPLWFSIMWGSIILFGLPFVWLYFSPRGEIKTTLNETMLPLLQWLFAWMIFVFLDKNNLTRKIVVHIPQKPVRLMLTIAVTWISILITASGIVFIFLITYNAISNGEVIQAIQKDMITYQKSYDTLIKGIEEKDLFPKLWLMITVVLFVPMTEEWLFRGLLFEGLSHHISTRWVILIQALLFALLHPLGFYTVLYVVIGLLLGWFRMHFNSLWPAVWAHQFQNALAFLSFAQGKNEFFLLDNSLFSPYAILSFLPLVTISVLVAFFMVKKLLHWPLTTAIENS